MKLNEAPDNILIAKYVEIRDARAQRKKAYDLDDEKDKGRQSKLEAEFLRRFNERGTDSSTAKGFGTAYKKIVSNCSVGDWDTYFNEYVLPNQAWDAIERRASKEFVQAFRDEHADIPPGINWSETVTVGFRRT